MRRFLIISFLLGFLLSAAILAAIVLRVQHRSLADLPQSETNSLRGAFHVHSSISHDGKISMDQIAIAARRAGLDFVILTEHNKNPEPPIMQRGVLFLRGTEWSTAFGHIIQLGGKPLAKEDKKSLEVVKKIRNNDGLAILAHPFDLKRPWEGPWEGLSGLEIVNSASALRDMLRNNPLRLIPMLSAVLMRQDLAWSQLYGANARALKRWHSEADSTPVGLCGVDLHGWTDAQKNLNHWNIVLPGPMPEKIEEKESHIYNHLANGAFYCSSTQNNQIIDMNLTLVDQAGTQKDFQSKLSFDSPQLLSVELPPQETNLLRIVLYRNGQRLMAQPGPILEYKRPGPGVYRVELEAELPKLLEGHYRATLAYSNFVKIAESLPDTQELSLQTETTNQ